MLVMIECLDVPARRDLPREVCVAPAAAAYLGARASAERGGLMAMLRASASGCPGGGRPNTAYD